MATQITPLVGTPVIRLERAASLADAQLKAAKDVALMNGLRDDPAIIAALVQAIAINYGTLLESSKS